MQRREKSAAAPNETIRDRDSGETRGGKYLTFRCGRQMLGVGISEVRQIAKMPQLVPLPDSPEFIKGIACMRGKAIPVMDLSLRLDKQETALGKRTCVIVFALEEYSFGAIVDAVGNLEDISEDEILPPPGKKESGIDYLLGIVERDPIVLLLHADFFLSADDLEPLLCAVDHAQAALTPQNTEDAGRGHDAVHQMASASSDGNTAASEEAAAQGQPAEPAGPNKSNG